MNAQKDEPAYTISSRNPEAPQPPASALYATESMEDARLYEVDPELGRDLEAWVIVKWLNQTVHDARLKQRAQSADSDTDTIYAPFTKGRCEYYPGLILRTALDTDEITRESAVLAIDALQPTAADIRGDSIAVACANKILSFCAETGEAEEVIENEGFARLHSIEHDSSGDNLLVTSSSLDMIYLVDQGGNPVWAFDAWQGTPHNTNRRGQRFFREFPSTPDQFFYGPTLDDVENDVSSAAYVIDPARLGIFGLTTSLTPNFINSAAFDRDGNSVLATVFQRGELWKIGVDDHTVEVIDAGLMKPHGIHPDEKQGGYRVTDTGREQVRFFDPEASSLRIIDFSSLGERTKDLEYVKWLQYVTYLGDGIYCGAMTARQRLVLFNPDQKTRRDIKVEPEWGVQMVIPHAKEAAK